MDKRSGAVRTRGSEPFLLDMEYVLYVKIEDRSALGGHGNAQSSGERRLSIVGGRRPPQFFSEEYGVSVAEDHELDTE